ncbi:MAG: LEPR-XLL domain-containing protein, partial [Desulfobacterales bacterium]|nr:LEPR-XLL domain-containing protein [Desulfobacterales bacterium]
MSFARWFHRQKKRRNEAAAKRRRKVLFEPIEPRILLSSDPLSYTAAAGAAIDMTLRLDDAAQELLLINNKETNPETQVVASQALADTSEVVITGADLDDSLTVDFSTPFSVPYGILFADAFTGDSDLLKVTGKASVWHITGGNWGNVDGAGFLDFIGIENLSGGAEADTYVFEAGGSTDGLIDGGEGADTLEAPDATNTWEITGADTGTLNTQVFESIENLIGGEADDTFVLGDGGGISGLIDGGGGEDTLVGPDADTDWTIDGMNAGQVAGVSFSGFENLTGGA